MQSMDIQFKRGVQHVFNLITLCRYENDPIAGQRLYRELQNSDKDKAKLRGHLVSPPATSQWETLATNLDEFQSVVVCI